MKEGEGGRAREKRKPHRAGRREREGEGEREREAEGADEAIGQSIPDPRKRANV